MSTIASLFAHTLKEIGVRYVFGVPSGNMIDYIEALRLEKDIDFILTGHEAAAAFMAAVTGRLSGVPGVCMATFGPGATNLSTGVGCAQLDRAPLLAFTDEMPDKLLNRTAQMSINHQQLFFPITKWTVRGSRQNLDDTILKAACIARHEQPGAVHVGLPAGIGRLSPLDSNEGVDYLCVEKKRWAPVPRDQWGKVFPLVLQSKYPVLAVGLSAARTGLQNEIQQLAERLQCPVVLTPMAKGMLNEEHDFYAGVLAHACSNQVARVYKQADLVIGIGYDPVELNYEDWMPAVPLIHVDAEPTEVDTDSIPELINITGKLEDAVHVLLEGKLSAKSWDVAFLKANRDEIFDQLTPTEEEWGPRAVVHDLRKILPPNGILTLDVGAHLHLVGQQWRTPSPKKLLMTNGWSSMGFAIPAANAAKLNCPEVLVVALMGDGGFRMMVGELATARRLNLKVVFVVICDQSLSLIRIKQAKKGFNSVYGTSLAETESGSASYYFGVPVIAVAGREEYRQALEKAFAQEGPVVIEAYVDGQEYDRLVLPELK